LVSRQVLLVHHNPLCKLGVVLLQLGEQLIHRAARAGAATEEQNLFCAFERLARTSTIKQGLVDSTCYRRNRYGDRITIFCNAAREIVLSHGDDIDITSTQHRRHHPHCAPAPTLARQIRWAYSG
jgi:hypothetical protein